MRMTFFRRGTLIVLGTVVGLILPTLSPPTVLHAQNDCYASLSEDPIEYGNCGTITYDLTYYVNYGYGNYSGDAGDYTVSGACYSYTDCDCNHEDGYTSGTITGESDGGPGLGYIDFWWDANNIEEYTYSSCTSGQCQNSGVVATPVTYYDQYIAYQTWSC